MAKKKKKKKLQKEVQKQVQNLTEKELIEKGREFLEAGKPRDAIGFLKLAAKKQGQTDDSVATLLFRAYLMREEQLREKLMTVEAEMVKKQAQEYMPKIESLSETDMLAYLSACSDQEALDVYAGYLCADKRSVPAEQFLANRLFKSNYWEFPDRLDENFPLRRDAEPMKKAIPLMNEGKWEDALDVLAPICRTSPFSAVRMFCRAMVSFYKEDDQDMLRALAMIPADFPLISVVKSLRAAAEKGKPGTAAPRHIPCLWEGPVNAEEDIRELLNNLEHQRLRQAKGMISDLSEAIYPAEPMAARTFILEILWNMTIQYKTEEYEFYKIVSDLLPGPLAELVLTKTRLLDFQTPFTTAGQYISILEKEFPDPETRKTAQAFILSYLVHKIQKNRMNTFRDRRGIHKYKDILGISTPNDRETVLIDMIAESIRLDPYSRSSYEIAVELPRMSKISKNKMETILTEMAERFSDDPWPCLELASVFYEKNAFRKAENILEEAMKRAPHDSRVMERHALSLLISAEKNIKREKFHIVERDVAKAEKLGNKKLVPFIAEKRILCEIVSNRNRLKFGDSKNDSQLPLFVNGKDLRTIIADELDPLSVFDRLKTLALFITDIRRRNPEQKKEISEIAEKVFDKALKNISDLPSSDLVRLLMPLEKDYALLMPSRDMAPLFLKKQKDMLKQFDDSDIITVFDLIFEPEWFGLIKKEIKRRVKKANKKEQILLNFYQAVLLHISGEEQGNGLFEDIIGQAAGPLREEVRAASRRLSKHASGTLKEALEMFDFDILDDVSDDDYDDNYDNDDFFPDSKMEGLQKLIQRLKALETDPDKADMEKLQKNFIEEIVPGFESFVDGMGLRGMPDFMINALREIIRSDPSARLDFDMLAELIEQSGGKERLSREARLILYGKKKRGKK